MKEIIPWLVCFSVLALVVLAWVSGLRDGVEYSSKKTIRALDGLLNKFSTKGKNAKKSEGGDK